MLFQQRIIRFQINRSIRNQVSTFKLKNFEFLAYMFVFLFSLLSLFYFSQHTFYCKPLFRRHYSQNNKRDTQSLQPSMKHTQNLIKCTRGLRSRSSKYGDPFRLGRNSFASGDVPLLLFLYINLHALVGIKRVHECVRLARVCVAEYQRKKR